jgi:hypothetical protein
MTLFYQTQSWSSQPQISEETINLWKHVKEDSWIDVTRRETLEGAEQAIDASIAHYEKKLGYLRGPQVVKTFE